MLQTLPPLGMLNQPLCPSNVPFRVLPRLIGLLPLPRQPQCLVREKLVAQGVARGSQRDSQDHTKGDQLRGDLLERAQALGDRVCCGE